MSRILLIEDNRDLAFGLRNNLEIEGYEVETAEDGMAGLKTFAKANPDLVILDLMLPKLDGFRVLRSLRQDGHATPVLLLTAKGEEADKVRGLRMGADDYVTKPFGIAELVARIRTALRHRFQEQGGEPLFKSGPLQVDLVRRVVTVSGEEVKLSPKEYDILRLLVLHAGKVLTHRFIMQQVWGAASDVQYLRIYVRQLRQKIEPDPERPALIMTETGVGYRLRVQGD